MAIRETVSDALWMSVLAGFGAVVAEAILLGCVYLSGPTAKKLLEDHSMSLLITFPVLFVATFALSLRSALARQAWREWWK